jgi:FixJ family two-component response regulator
LSASRKVIAIVDDEENLLRGLTRLLDTHKIKTKTFSSGEAFLERAEDSNIACVVLDINLGAGMSGIETRRRLAAKGVSLPIIFITALDSAAVRKEAMEAGCAAFLPKPFSGKELIGAIRKAAPLM